MTVNECQNNPCKGNATCIDKEEGFTCICTNGYKLGADQVSCHDRDGNYTEWTTWTTCTKTCGSGIQYRNRTCTNPSPRGKGSDCTTIGSNMDKNNCNTNRCPLSEVELSNGIVLRINSSITVANYLTAHSTVSEKLSSSINNMCHTNFSQCCGKVGTRKQPNKTLSYMEKDGVKIGTGFPLKVDNVLEVLLLIVANKSSELCNDILQPVRKRRSVPSLSSFEIALPQSLLEEVLNSDSVKNAISTELSTRFGVKVSILKSSMPVQVTTTGSPITTVGVKPKPEEEEKKWVIPVAVVCAIVGVAIIVLIIVIVLKRPTKVVDSTQSKPTEES